MMALGFIIGDWNEATEFGDVILVMLFLYFKNMYRWKECENTCNII